MIIQWVYRGMGNIMPHDVNEILNKKGIVCNRILNNNGGYPTEEEITDSLTDSQLNWHQNKFDDKYDLTQQPYRDTTPFISTTAGTVERSRFFRTNLFYPAWLTALEFATNKGRRDGWIFHCYVFVLGKKSVGIRHFSEELRELNIYKGFSPYHPEGEIAAKIHIPAVQIHRALFYPKQSFDQARRNNKIPEHDQMLSKINADFISPDKINNVRDVLY